MRILAVTNMFPTESSPGTGTFVAEQIRSLTAAGLGVRVLFIDRRREGPGAYYRIRARLAKEIREFDPDLTHIMYGGVMASQVLKYRHTRPVLVTFHGSDLLGENLSGWTRKLISRYGVWCSRRAASVADGIVVVARHLLNALPSAAAARKALVLPCGIDLTRFKPMNSKACRHSLCWKPDSFHVLFASSNRDPVKRPWLAKAALDEALRRGIPAELHTMTGVPNSEVPVWLNASDVLLLTSLHEGSPTVVKEALACALPVVSVDVGDVRERIEEIDGCYLSASNPLSLAEKLALVYYRRTRLSCQDRLADISVVRVASRLKALYDAVVEHRATAFFNL